ncbi:DUF6930 domain-containing protein [Pseudanabaena sp. 'Roaring Creek']|uniref:DUF6930 domain-containing protein n=1 Tax=Pseudanabaena sp. 'Roaring Creek' TaxID=1681830 RepID=UPI0006D773FF|nr:hypothetical protein [Pseudanabaena sp. 'Roaring Creek']
MTTLNRSTLRRLKKLKQSSAVWEGDRRSLPAKIRQPQDSSNIIPLHAHSEESKPHCILWVDGSQGMVRSMDVVDSGVGQEAFVRALLQAIEHPQSPAQPSLPQKILVCDRELQFYLRGVLQDLDISVEYVERLPLIDEIFSHILESFSDNPPIVPERFSSALHSQSEQIWRNAPWNTLWDHQVISLEIDRWDIDTLYAIVMGKMGLEQGVIFYRSEESLVKFRHRIVSGSSEDEIEETFLHQDCLFNLFETPDLEMEGDLPPFPFRGKMRSLPTATTPMKPIYGALHPLEGGRPYLYDEEAIALTVALEALNKFWEQYHKRLSTSFSNLSGTYTIYAPNPDSDAEEPINVVVKTMPDLANELHQLVVEEDDDDDDDSPLINEDLWPENALIHMMTIPWEQVEFLRKASIHHQLSESISPILGSKKGEGLPGLMIQTSRPKALELIEQIDEFNGIHSLCFNPAEDIFGNICQLGLMVMGNDDLHLFGEFDKATLSGEHHKRWKQRTKNTKGNVCVIVAMGITGASRGNPAPHHILGYYEIKLIDDKELGLGKLRAEPAFDFDF